jgi:hypothetical protein
MPDVPILSGWMDWYYLLIGIPAMGMLWWRRNVWTRASISIVLFALSAYAFHYAGKHNCAQGNPPALLEYTAGGVAAALPWIFGRLPILATLSFTVVLFAGTATARYLAESYHGAEITGNPEFSNGRFWHTPFTGQYPCVYKEWFKPTYQHANPNN